MTREFYDGAVENESEQQFMMPMYQEECDCSDYDDEDFENLSEDVFAPFDDYPYEEDRYQMYPEFYHRPYPIPYPIYPIYPIYRYPMYRRYPIYRRYPRYEMYQHYPMRRY